MDRDIHSVGPDHSPIIGRTVVVAVIMLIIASIHAIRVGSYLDGRWFTLCYSYFSDIIVPFGMYFLLCLNEVGFRFLRDWRVKAGVVFGISSLTELGQAVGIPLLGLTFDPLDFVMFVVGVSFAVVVDRVLFERVFPSGHG